MLRRLSKTAARMSAKERRHYREGELGPGVSRKTTTPLPTVKKPQTWEFSAHPHHAERAGKHIDIRLGNPGSGIAHSFVLPKRTELPAPGESARVIPTFDHTMAYMDYTGPITTRYGRGEVKKGRREKTEVYHADPSDEAGTKLRFNLYEGAQPEEYAIRKDDRGRWFVHNKTQTRMRREDIPDFKPKYKEIDVDSIDPRDDRQAMMPKLDGAHAVIDLQSGRSPRVFSYRTAKKAETGLIEHTHKMPTLLEKKVPKSLDRTIIRGEILGVDKSGRAIPAEKIGGMLNAKVWESRKKQADAGVRLKAFPFDVVMHKGKSMDDASFEEKLKVLREVEQGLSDLEVPFLATSAEDKIELMNVMRAGKHPLTEEGFVLVDREAPGRPIKAKFSKDYDVYVRDIHAAAKKGGGTHDRAGAVSYSWTPDGPIAGQFGGFKHEEAKDMLANPEKYKGRVAKAKAMRAFTDKEGNPTAMFQPRFQEWHLDKGDIEKAAFLDELEKIAKETKSDLLKGLLGGAVGVGVGLGALLIAKPMLGTHLKESIKSLGRGGARMAERKAAIPVGAVADARQIAKALLERGIDPKKAKIAISGTGGTGKSTMAKELADELKMSHNYLDDVGLGTLRGRDLTSYLKRAEDLPSGTIFEQTHLLNQANPDKFDVIIRMFKDPKQIKKQLKIRKRGAYQWDLYDYKKLHKAVSNAFHRTEGAVVSPAKGVEFKVRPPKGFRASHHLDTALRDISINPKGMSRQEKVISVSTGKKPLLPGILPYLRKDTILQAAAAAGIGSATGSLVATKVI